MKAAVIHQKNNEAGSTSAAKSFFAKSAEKSFFSDHQQAAPFFSGIQTKLTVGQPGDQYEQEADAMADQVMRMSTSNTSRVQTQAAEEERDEAIQTKFRVQRQAKKDDEVKETSSIQPKTTIQSPLEQEENVQTKLNSNNSNASHFTILRQTEEKIQKLTQQDEEEKIQKLADEEKEEEGVQTNLIQRKSDSSTMLQTKTERSAAVAGNFESRLSSTKGYGKSLDSGTRQFMESRFNADFSQVKVHTDTSAEHMNQQVHAQAFAHGSDIYFNRGKYNPGTSTGKQLLAHELTHTIQQGASVQTKPQITHTPLKVQRFLPDFITDELADYARDIPGYTLMTVIVGFDPLRGEAVEQNAINLIRGLMGLVPFGDMIFERLNEYGVIQDAYNWVSGQIHQVGLSVARIEQLIEEAWDEMDLLEGFSYNLEVIRRKFNELYNRITTFASSLVDRIIQFIKDALITPLQRLAASIPGYSLLVKILGYDPFTDEPVEATTVQILEEFLILIGKQTELEQMRERGSLQRTADWLDTQIIIFSGLMAELKTVFLNVWNSFTVQSLFTPLDTLNQVVTAFRPTVGRIMDFAYTVAITVLQFIKDALLGWLKSHADSIPGYHLLSVILGKDPVTDEIVPRSVENIIRGFMSLIPGGMAQFQQLQETGAIAQASARIGAMVDSLGITWEFIKNLFLGLWNSFTINDLIAPLEAFGRIIARFGEPLGRLLAFVSEVVMVIIEVVLQVMNVPIDLAQAIIANAMQAIEDIKRDPIEFLKNLLRALKQGFVQFFDHIVTHLIGGVTGWLMSELRDANVPAPQDFSLRGIISWVLEVLGISMENIWAKLAAHPRIGPQRVARIRSMINALEGIWTFIKDVQERGMAAIWDKIQEQLSNLWNTVLDAVKNFIMERIINRITSKLLSMLDPTGIMAVINGAMALFNAIQSFIRYLREMLEVVNSFVSGVADIAQGNVTTAANYLERTMGQAMPVVIGFLANQVGLSGLGSRIAEIIGAVRETVDRALTWLVNRAVDTGLNLLDRLMGRSADESNVAPQSRDIPDTNVVVPFTMGEAHHDITFTSSGGNIGITMASSMRIVLSMYLSQGLEQVNSMPHFQGKTRIKRNLEKAIQDSDEGRIVEDWRMNNISGTRAKNLPDFIQERMLKVVESLKDLALGDRKIPAIVGLYDLLNKNTRMPGSYAAEPDPIDVAPFAEFSSAQRRRILDLNKASNNNVIMSDCVPGEILHDGDPNDPLKANIDHIYPRAKGGSNSYSNAQVISRADNIRKSDLHEGCP